MAPILLFGLGATKAGTSWLHRWLAGHPECHFRTLKELHYFDAIEAGRVARHVVSLTAEREALAREGVAPRRLRDIDDYLGVLARPDDRGAYLDYLSDGAGGARVVGDITPAYGLLPVARLKEMAALGEARFLYILRDPVARLWSHVRMIAGRREPDGSVTAERAGRILKRTLRGDEGEIEKRSDYRGALKRLFEAVPEARRLVVFFEDLFTGDATARICAFLGITPAPALADVVHGGQALDMTPDQRAAARAWLDDQYGYVARAMGRVPPAWAERV